MKTMICVLLTIQHFALFGSSPHLLSFHQAIYPEQLNQIQNQYIEINGFFYSLEDGSHLLASRPNLRSCCVGSSSNAHEQLLLRGLENPPETHQVVTVRGFFKYDAIENRMELHQTQVVETKPNDGTVPFLIFGGLLFLLLVLFGVKNIFKPHLRGKK